jgi:hypothetical protein
MESIMLFWTLFTACNTEDPVAETDPVAGSIRLCLPEDVQPSMETEEPNFLRGSLLDIREGSGDCTAELVFQTEEAEHVIGYSILDPEGNDASFIPSWTSAENVTLSTHISFVFGMSYGLVLEDDSGIMLALDEGTWGGALQDAELPFEVGQSENDIGSTEQECMTKTGFALTIGDDELLPFGEFDIAIDEQNFTFIAVSAVEYGPGTSCSISDMSDEFAWGIFKE